MQYRLVTDLRAQKVLELFKVAFAQQLQKTEQVPGKHHLRPDLLGHIVALDNI